MKTFSSSTRSIIWGSLIAPFAVLPATILLSLGIALFTLNFDANYFEGIQFFVIFTLLISFPLMTLVAAPLAIVLNRFNMLSLKVVLLLSLVVSSFLSVTLVSPAIKTWLVFLFYSTSIILGQRLC